ncbi:MAG: translation initiation factor IF-2 subunit gamma [Candidatus Micrarchaeota archaeon]
MAQAELNVMTAGHVDNGKTTLVAALTGRWTSVHSEELKRGITIRLGYADFSVKKCPECSAPKCYCLEDKCRNCGSQPQEARKISFVDAPGHETLLATVIAASSIIDGALFVIAANEKCPQPQTTEHLMVLEAAKVKKVVVAQNKVDLVNREQAVAHYKQIKEFLRDTPYSDAEIIPTAANSKLNLDALVDAIERNIPTPKRDPSKEALMYAARSFDVNKPGTPVNKLVGGVIGGSIRQGVLRPGDEVEILPGALHVKKEKETYSPLCTRVTSLNAGGEELKEAHPGGLVGMGTELDPALTHADALVGSFVGRRGTLPPARNELSVEALPMERQVEKFVGDFGSNEPLVLGVGTATTVGFVTSHKKSRLELVLKKPLCVKAGDVLAVMRRAQNRWHLYGTAKVL